MMIWTKGNSGISIIINYIENESQSFKMIEIYGKFICLLVVCMKRLLPTKSEQNLSLISVWIMSISELNKNRKFQKHVRFSNKQLQKKKQGNNLIKPNIE